MKEFQNTISSFHYKVFQKLTNMHYYVTEGGTFGCDFIAYSEHPSQSHSNFLIFVINNIELNMNDMIIKQRLAESVKKVAILAFFDNDEIKFIKVQRWKT